MLETLQPLIAMKGAGIRRSDRWLVRGVDLIVRPGEIVTLIGPNGSGKSTTARMAVGALRPTEGSVTRSPDLRIGYVPQRITVNWIMPLSVRRFMRLTSPLPDPEIQDALTATGVRHLIDSETASLSGGEFQRVMLARAIARKPQLLVLDEPAQGIDFNGEAALYELIARIRSELGCGVLLISHDLHIVMAETDHVICLNGHVCCQGSPTAVTASEEYLRMFGGRSPALAVYRHSHDHTHLPDGRVRHADGSVTNHCHPRDGHHHHEKSAGTAPNPVGVSLGEGEDRAG